MMLAQLVWEERFGPVVPADRPELTRDWCVIMGDSKRLLDPSSSRARDKRLRAELRASLERGARTLELGERLARLELEQAREDAAWVA